MPKSNDPETRGQQLAEELESTLNAEFESRADYREAVETVHCHFEAIINGLDADDKRDEGED